MQKSRAAIYENGKSKVGERFDSVDLIRKEEEKFRDSSTSNYFEV